MPGAPTKLTPEVLTILKDSLLDNQSIISSCKNANISYDSYKKWYRDKIKFKKYIDSVYEEVRQNGRTTAIKSIFKAMQDGKNWTAGAWWLERNFVQEFGKLDRQDININQITTTFELTAGTQQPVLSDNNDIQDVEYTEENNDVEFEN